MLHKGTFCLATSRNKQVNIYSHVNCQQLDTNWFGLWSHMKSEILQVVRHKSTKNGGRLRFAVCYRLRNDEIPVDMEKRQIYEESWSNAALFWFVKTSTTLYTWNHHVHSFVDITKIKMMEKQNLSKFTRRHTVRTPTVHKLNLLSKEPTPHYI